MKDGLKQRGMGRREFLERAALGSLVTVGGVLPGCGQAPVATEVPAKATAEAKTILTFYIDDANPYTAGADAFRQFLDYASDHGLGGEASLILGYDWKDQGVLRKSGSEEQQRFIEQARRAFDCGIDSHMELMTHAGRFDFAAGQIPEGAQHEGIWLHEPAVTQADYEAYFGHILDAGRALDLEFTGVTWPGCGCGVCEKRYAELRQPDGSVKVNPNLWKALLSLAEQNRFRGKTAPCFVLGGLEEHPVEAMASRGDCGVYDLYPQVEDKLGIWDNLLSHVDADYYIDAEGRSGKIVEKVRAGASHLLFYGHWQGVNPVNGVGWEAFQTVVSRVEQHLGDEVRWMRPSALTDLVQSGELVPTAPKMSL